jgi:glycosyltransferase involved in cell wall biosynthesis
MSAFPVLSETFVTNEIRAMRRIGHKIIPMALESYNGPCQPEDEPMRAEAIKLADISRPAALRFGLAHPRGFAAALKFANRQTSLPVRSLMWAATRVAYSASRAGCSHIHAHYAHSTAATAIAAAHIAGLTCSFIGHGHDIYSTPLDVPVKLATADIAFATCNDMANDFRRMAATVNAKVVYCGIDPDRFAPSAGTPGNGRVLAIGRLSEEKGYAVLFDALTRIPAAKRPVVDIVGAGPLDADLKRLAIELGLRDNIHFLGGRPSSWIAAEGPSYQGFVAPYLADTNSVAVKEALAMGLPVVASRLMGMKESVNLSCGRHVDPGDAAGLAEALAWLAALGPAERQALGAAGRLHALANYTLAAQAAGMTAAIREIQSRRPARCAA